jgi:hypothetical protein
MPQRIFTILRQNFSVIIFIHNHDTYNFKDKEQNPAASNNHSASQESPHILCNPRFTMLFTTEQHLRLLEPDEFTPQPDILLLYVSLISSSYLSQGTECEQILV